MPFDKDITVPNESKGFTGERYDGDAGLQYLNARYYDPKLAMFIQPDWWEVTKAGVGTNRYSYSFDDPVNKSDGTGHATTDDSIKDKNKEKIIREYDKIRKEYAKSRDVMDKYIKSQTDSSIVLSKDESRRLCKIATYYGASNVQTSAARIRDGYQSLVDKIGDPGKGYIVRQRDITVDGKIAQAAPGGNRASLQKLFMERYAVDGIYNKNADPIIDWKIQVTLAHEVVHSALNIGPEGDKAYGSASARALISEGTLDPLRNMDNWVFSTFPTHPEQ